MGTILYQLRSLKMLLDFFETAVIFQKESDISSDRNVNTRRIVKFDVTSWRSPNTHTSQFFIDVPITWYIYCRKSVQHNISTKNGNGFFVFIYYSLFHYIYCLASLSLGFETRILRECGFLNATMNCQKMGMNDVSGQFICSCSGDGCNSSSQLKPEMAFLSFLTMVAFSTLRP